MYDKYLEKCCLCDSNRTEISHKDKLAKRNGLEFSFTQVYIHCHDCGYDFVNKELSSINFENRDQIVNNDGFIYGHIASSMITQANMQTVDLVNEILLQSELNGQLLTYNLEIDQ